MYYELRDEIKRLNKTFYVYFYKLSIVSKFLNLNFLKFLKSLKKII